MPDDSISQKVERQARRAILEHALLRVENALIIAGALLATYFIPQPFPWWPAWGWAALGGLGVMGMVAGSLSDPEHNRQVVSNLFLQEFSTASLSDRTIKTKMEQALDYYRRIQAAVEKQKSGLMQDRLTDTVRQINEWLVNMFELAHHLDAYRRDAVIKRDLQAVPREISSYRQRLNLERDASVRQQMEAAIEARAAQFAALDRLENMMEKAEFQLEQSLAALGTVYPQVQLIGARDVDSSRTQRLQADISNQVSTLNDLITSINEVYTYDAEHDIGALRAAPPARQSAASVGKAL